MKATGSRRTSDHETLPRGAGLILVAMPQELAHRRIRRFLASSPSNVAVLETRDYGRTCRVLEGTGHLDGVVIDYALPHAGALAVLRQHRERLAAIPVLVVARASSACSARVVNVVQSLGAMLTCGPLRDESLSALVASVNGPVGLRLARAFLDGRGLTDREHAAVISCLCESDRRSAAAALDLSVNTLKGHLKTAFRKCGVASMTELLRRILTSG
jgi:DNA-binding NarL/FixJ family response regulator